MYKRNFKKVPLRNLEMKFALELSCCWVKIVRVADQIAPSFLLVNHGWLYLFSGTFQPFFSFSIEDSNYFQTEWSYDPIWVFICYLNHPSPTQDYAVLIRILAAFYRNGLLHNRSALLADFLLIFNHITVRTLIKNV